MNDQLQELLDKKACEELVLRYSRTLDWLDTSGQSSCFWPDADIDYGFFKGNGSDWVTTVMQVEQASLHRWHMSTSILIQVNGDKATGECYGITVGTSETEEGQMMDTLFGGRYLDEFEKRNGEWRISKRTFVLDWTKQDPNSVNTVTEGFTLNTLDIHEPDHPMYRPIP